MNITAKACGKAVEDLGRAMSSAEEMDQFQMLEEKVDSLLRFVDALRKEKESLVKKIQIQEERISDLINEMETLKANRDKAKQRIVSLLEKIEQLEI